MKNSYTMNRLCLAALLAASLLTAGCNDDNEPQPEETVLKPIAEHITGKWQMTGFSVFENGKWEEQSNDNSVGIALNFRPDGTEVRVMTYSDGFTALATRTWSVDEDAATLTDGTSQQRIHRLTADELVTEASQSMDPGTGEITQNQARWTYRRATEQDLTLAEQLVGKWRPSKVYGYHDYGDGYEWVLVSEADENDETYIEFKEDGTVVGISTTNKYKWSAHTAAMLLRVNDLDSDLPGIINQIEMPDDDTLGFYRGGFKTVYARESN
jgi:hypothetical protein